MLNPPNYKPWRSCGPTPPISSANAHAIREAGRKGRTQARHELHTRLREAEESKEEHEQDITQFQILEEYAATVEGALNIDGLKQFGYAGIEMQEALSKIQTSLSKLEKRGEL